MSDHKISPAETTSPSNNTSLIKPSRFKDPRVVRVSRALGGKDRHSKVCTVRGLRDRRVRLSVPTAIQLYDLQERLGLNQPSKVVDWLLNAAKSEIDELPPLQIPQGMFNFTTQDDDNNNINNSYNLDQPTLNFQDFGSCSHSPDKQGVEIRSGHDVRRDETWARNQEDTNMSSYNSSFRLNTSNLTLSHIPRVSHVTPQHDDWPSFGFLPFQQTVPSGSHQVLLYHQPAGVMSTHLPTSSYSSTVDSASQPLRHIHFNMTANLLPSQEYNDGNRP